MVLAGYLVYGGVMRFGQLPDDSPDEPLGVPFHFDLAPTPWASQLLDAAANDQVDVPWVSWHPDRDSVMVMTGDGVVLVATRLRRRASGWSVMEVAAVSSDGDDEPDTGRLPDVIVACRDLADRFTQLSNVIEKHLTPWRTSTRGQGARRPETSYAALAARYVELVNTGERHPAKVLAAELGMSPVTVSQRIREARTQPLGLLTDATHGAAGGMLTEKAKRLLMMEV